MSVSSGFCSCVASFLRRAKRVRSVTPTPLRRATLKRVRPAHAAYENCALRQFELIVLFVDAAE